METGRTVILLNLESLYESLYDALNQVWIGRMCERFFMKIIPSLNPFSNYSTYLMVQDSKLYFSCETGSKKSSYVI